MNKKLTLVFLGLLLLFSIFPYTAMAATKKEGMGGILDTVYDIFNWIPQYLTLEKLMSGDEKAMFLARLLVWIIIFSMTHFGLKFIGSKGVRTAIAFVIGVMGAALIPEKILFNIFQTYSVIGAVVIWAIPMIFGYLAINKISKEHSFIRAFIYLIIFLVLYSINDSMDEFFGYRGMESWFGYFKLLYIPAIFGFLSNLTRGVSGKGFESTKASNWNPFKWRRTPTTADDQRLDRDLASDAQIDNYIARLQNIETQLTTERSNLANEDYQVGERRNQLVQRILNLQREFNQINQELAQLGVF